MRAIDRPLPIAPLGLTQSNSSHSSARNGRCDQIP
jgi:hypothetical protein